MFLSMLKLPTKEGALVGRPEAMVVAARHRVLEAPLDSDFPLGPGISCPASFQA
jgi:hypothetical protein